MSVILNAINYFWKLGFNEEKTDLYVKNYSDSQAILIDVANEIMDYGGQIHTVDKDLTIFSQKNFIILEAIDRFLRKGHRPEDIYLGGKNSFDLFIRNGSDGIFIAIRCLEFEEEYDEEIRKLRSDYSRVQGVFEENVDIQYFCAYTSRLKAGTIENKYTVFQKSFSIEEQKTYQSGLLEPDIQPYLPKFSHSLQSKKPSFNKDGFKVVDGILAKYTGDERHVIIPDGVEKLKNSVFWNCLNIEKITIPNSVTSLGGDTFYNCRNLTELTIPESVDTFGDNPFAGCPKLNLINKSPHFVFEDEALFDKDFTRLIHCAIKRESDVFEVPDTVISVSKHSFYNCQNLRKIVIPLSVKIMENNPFSDLPNLKLVNNSPHFILKDGALYNKTMTTLHYYEHGSETNHLIIPEGVTIIGRHSFYNCQTIEKITIPSSVEEIGYNPFTNCSRLTLENHSPEYVYENGALYTKNKTEIIYYSIRSPAETFIVPDTVKKIGRSVFYNCKNLKKVVIPDSVTIIDRSAFANCDNLREVSIPDSIEVLGEWAFVNCTSLEFISLPEHVSLEPHTFLNCPVNIIWRKE